MPDIFIASKKDPKSAIGNMHQSIASVNSGHNPGGHTIPGLFSTFIKYPHKFSFTHQDKNEQIILFVRRHFATNYLWISISAIALLIAPLFLIFLQFQNLFQFPISPAFIVVLIYFYYLIIIGIIFYKFVDWFYNMGIITQKRIIDIDFLHLSYIDIAITQLPEVEDVIQRQKGFFASYFDYGDVIAHTVAGKEDFIFEKIPHPAKVVDLLSKLIAD